VVVQVIEEDCMHCRLLLMHAHCACRVEGINKAPPCLMSSIVHGKVQHLGLKADGYDCFTHWL
jgi:hypothetical protein